MSTIVYVANAESRDISVLSLDLASGALVPLQQQDASGRVMPLALSPDKRFLYASIRSEPIEVASFAIDPGDGRLAEIGRAPLPASSCWIATDRSGRFLLSAAYAASCIAVSPIDAGGVARAALQSAPTGKNAHSVQADPANRFLFSACLGAGVILGWRFDASSGHFAANDASTWHARPGAGPRHFAFHPQAPFVYLVNELDARLDVLAYDAERGLLRALQTVETLPPAFAGKPWAADIHFSPDGRFLYTCERSSSTLAAFAVDAASGLVTPLGHVPTETQPRSFAIDPSGRWLVAAGQLSGAVSVHAIDAATGGLERRGACAVGRDPNWVEIVALA